MSIIISTNDLLKPPVSKQAVLESNNEPLEKLRKLANIEFTLALHTEITNEIQEIKNVECQSCHNEGISENPYQLCKSCLEDFENWFQLNS